MLAKQKIKHALIVIGDPERTTIADVLADIRAAKSDLAAQALHGQPAQPLEVSQ